MNFSNNILHRRGILSTPSFSPLQSQVDGLVGGFAAQATDWRSLASIAAGGMAYRVGRIGILGLGSGVYGTPQTLAGLLRGLAQPGLAVRAASVGFGLAAEVSAFELTHRGLHSLHSENPNLWRWSGSGGIRQGLFQSFITFGTLKGAGYLARGENVVLQHLLQDSAMVAGHQASGLLGIAPRPTGSLAEQFLHAEATNLQLGAGMAIAHRLLPGAQALERGLDFMSAFPRGGREGSRPAEEGTPIQYLTPLEVTGGGREPRPSDYVFAMSNGNGNRGRNAPPARPRGGREPTLPVVTIWDPYHIEGMPADAKRVRLEGPPDQISRRLEDEILRHLGDPHPKSLIVGLEIERARDLREEDLMPPLYLFLRDRHAQDPLPNGFQIAVVIPSKNSASLLTVEGRDVRMKRSYFDARGAIFFDDTPDSDAEAAARESRESLPGMAVATTILQVFEALKNGINRGDPEIVVQYEGGLWSEGTAENFAKWLRTGRNQLSPEQTAAIFLPRFGQKIIFSREGEEVRWKMEALAPEAEVQAPPPSPTPEPFPSLPSLAESPSSPRPRRPTPPAPSSRAARKTPASRPGSIPPVFGGIALDLASLRSKVAALRLDASGGDGELVYGGRESLPVAEVERIRSGFSGLKENQRVCLYLIHSQEVIEFTGTQGDIAALRTVKTDQAAGPFSAVSANSWGELFQKASALLSRDLRESHDAQVFYRGREWSTARALEDLRLFLSIHPLREGQSFKIQAGRGEAEISIKRELDRVQVEIREEGSPVQQELWRPDLATGYRRMDPTLGKNYPYLPLEDYHALAVQLVNTGLGKREISDIIQQRVHTGLPVETLAQAPAYRGRLLAAIAEDSAQNRQIPQYLQLWLQAHQFIERAYAHFDLETVLSFRRHLQSPSTYDKILREYNESLPAGERLLPLEEMPIDLPGTSFLPREFALRDAFVRQVAEKGRSVAQNRLLLSDPERLGAVFAGLFNNRMTLLFAEVDFLSKEHPQGAHGALLDKALPRELQESRRTLDLLFPEFHEYLRILNEGTSPAQRDFLRGALQSQANMRQSYIRFYDWVQRMPPLLSARHSLPKLPSLEHLDSRSTPSTER